ncbi:YjbE family putative metal transport protein [Paenibacillus sp. OV219]|uniref:YjbE family putative metal transport protein n=1 Tax=Paenibacillus sp. OV219 TaxID=1884377 RepID=UPI0008CBFBD0|nr:YjbE family putative metal transport protein [Paenibacillus sp. OV219]SEN10575.1 integral membrane protein, YjbE family [Paenibacillus sp. OV219]
MDSLIIFIQIIFINVLLSGDNAVVIALASQQLPHAQRKKAVLWGAVAAVGLRCVLTLVALTLLQVPYLQAVGSLLLFMIAVKLVTDASGHAEQFHNMRKVTSLSSAVRTIVIADFIMSLDNVLAIAAVAEGEPVLILLGIALSIPMIIWGSQLLSTLLRKFPSFVYIGGGLLGYAAGEMLVHDPAIHDWLTGSLAVLTKAIPLLSIPIVIIVALLRIKR